MTDQIATTRLTYPELEDYIRGIDAAAYARTRNHLGGSTRLSEYITRGAINLPRVRELILENHTVSQAYKLINELAWREYFQLVWRVKGAGIFEYFRPAPTEPRNSIPQAVLDAETGIQALDDGIRQLRVTGYIDNHMRMWLAGLICNVARCDWRIGADWMHSQLIDGDYASNHHSWQWVAGTYTGKTYLPQQANINKYAPTTQHGSYLDQPYSVINDMPVPERLARITNQLPTFENHLPVSTISPEELPADGDVLLYSPWTLDSRWQPGSPASRILLIDHDMFTAGRFSQNVLDSIRWFATQVPGLQVMYDRPAALQPLANHITRQYYPGIADWPGTVEEPALLFPHVPSKFYRSFSAFWKECQKHPADS